MNKRPVCKINGLKYPAADRLSGRSSTITRSMACTLLRREPCSPEIEKKWIRFFPNSTCAYCGKPATHLDHLHPLINDKVPSGYCTEPANLVPCCKECNQSKRNLYWKDFMQKGLCKHVGDSKTDDPDIAMQHRIKIIEDFQKEMPAEKVEINETLISEWKAIQENLETQLDKAQKKLLEIKNKFYS